MRVRECVRACVGFVLGVFVENALFCSAWLSSDGGVCGHGSSGEGAGHGMEGRTLGHGPDRGAPCEGVTLVFIPF